LLDAPARLVCRPDPSRCFRSAVGSIARSLARLRPGRLAAAVLLAAATGHATAAESARSTAASSSASVETDGPVTTVRLVNRSFALGYPEASGNEAVLLLRQEIETVEVLGEKGLDGHVRLDAWPLDGKPESDAPLFTISASGQDGRVEDGALYVIERGLEEILWQSTYSLTDGARLFDATTPWLRAANGGLWKERRYIALAQVFDDAEDAALRRDDAVALISYASTDGALDHALIVASDTERARYLRSVWDQRVALGWRDLADGSAVSIDALPDPLERRLAVEIAFEPDGARVLLPLGEHGFERSGAALPDDLTVEAFPPNLLLGRWRVAEATPAPWAVEDAAHSATVALFEGLAVEVGEDRVSSETPLACGGARYTTALVPAEGLFQGGVDPAQAAGVAAALGLSPDAIRAVALTCDTGVYDFYFRDPDTAFLAFDNVVFTLAREP
jgi:hypothetical protein